MEGHYSRSTVIESDTLSLVPAASQTSRTAWSTGAIAVGLFCIMLALLTGCADKTSLIPNSDPALRKTKTEFARDALSRQPYHADAPRGGKINGGATVDYADDNLLLANFTDEDWKDVEVWVNKLWVVFVPLVPGHAETAKTIDFAMMYDAMGRPFPSENTNKESFVNKVEIFRDGKMYDLAGLTAE